ncbi:MAG TPA: hypothetical protein VKE22_18895 [Haliangiales bacterium]|nr:hypothetical protein [Haliangiales bacterium]
MIRLALALVAATKLLGGDHWRIDTDRGPVHVYCPDGYDASLAGTVVYIHGYWSDVDEAWREHKLAEQFVAANKQALFIVPEAPMSLDDDVRWASLGDLLRAVHGATGLARPDGPVVVVGHSGAYRTIVPWLDYEPLENVILLDAFYGNEEEYVRWLNDAKGHAWHRLTIVADDTVRFAEPFVKRFKDAVTLTILPATWEEAPPEAKKAKLLYVRSQVRHMPLVTDGKALPFLLGRAPLRDRVKVRAP